jgi:dTDP-4-dehydrorhamnose 3,5-epimerase-like enzyme
MHNSTPFSLPKLPSKIRHIYFTNNKHKYKFRLYNDPDIGIAWPFELIGGKENLIISEKDLNLMSFKEYDAKMMCK